MRWSSIELWEQEAKRRAEESQARRRKPSRAEKLAAVAAGLIIPLGFLLLYVLAGILTGGPH